MNDVTLLGIICLAMSLWVLRLQIKLVRAEKFGYMALMALRDVADNKVEITRNEDGDISIKKLKGESK